ncbi:hypothetical protein GCM10009785_00020 [Brooklawnia cerclae]|uniref:Uncharacterized protein n=1 Tax=Brooklawnia cerclae TaxID=349934 RepID=A0ABX0SJC5_9ACTN|nr:hypothetical protein [Brooklawnia cerclae]NIH58483.1 hypothetical protein [Brooklawnia cerclae]
MSAETKQALHDAIEAHIADENGERAIVGAYVVLADNTDFDDIDHGNNLVFAVSDGNRFAVRGLVEAYHDIIASDWAYDDPDD